VASCAVFGRLFGAFDAPAVAIAAIATAIATTKAAAPPPIATTAFGLAALPRPTAPPVTATHLVPFHRVLPSGDKVDSHFWPSQYHLPSGEICPGSPSPMPYSHGSQPLIQARLQ